MLYQLYGNRQVDDTNIGCHKVLYADCDGIHKYKTICELVKECHPGKQLKNDCIVDFFNSDLSSHKGEFLQVTPNGCLTTANPVCPCDDRKVGATDNDTNPGTLDKKLTGGCDSTGTYCISVGTPNPNTVQVIPSGPINGFTQFKGKPACDDSIVKMRGDGSVYTECPELKEGMRYAICRHSGGFCKFPRNTTGRIYAVNGANNEAFSFSGSWSIRATPGFSKGAGDTFINIEEPGLYLFNYTSFVLWTEPYIYAIRAGLWIWDYELGDVKYNGPHFKTSGGFNIHSNMVYPQSNDNLKGGAMAIDQSGYSFSGSFVLPLNAISKSNPAKVRFSVKPDTRTDDPRHTKTGPTHIYLANAAEEIGPQTIVTITKIGGDPLLYGFKTI